MEITDLRYFLSVAECENVNRAAVLLSVAPSTVSKSIGRLEAELEVRLFERIGKSIRITEHGLYLRRRASEMVSHDEATKLFMSGGKNSFLVKLCGEEILFEHYAVKLMGKILSLYPNARFQLLNCSPDEATRKVEYGEAHLALTTQPLAKHLKSKTIDAIDFKTYIGRHHSLYKSSKDGVSIEDVLRYRFVIPESSLFGLQNKSSDGWRDDKFPRDIGFRTSSLNVLTGLVNEGLAIAYLPTYIGETKDFKALSIHDCPFECKQKIYLHASRSNEFGWLNQIW